MRGRKSIEKNPINVKFNRAQVYEKSESSTKGYILLGIEPSIPENFVRRRPVDSVILFEYSEIKSSNFSNSNRLEITKNNILSLTTGTGYRHSSDRLAICSNVHNMLPLQPYSNIRPSLLLQKLATLSATEHKPIEATSFLSALSILNEAPQTYYKRTDPNADENSSTWDKQRDRARLIVIINEESQDLGLHLPQELIDALINKKILLILLILDSHPKKSSPHPVVPSFCIDWFPAELHSIYNDIKDCVHFIRLSSLEDGVLSPNLIESLGVSIATNLKVHLELPGWRVTGAVPFITIEQEMHIAPSSSSSSSSVLSTTSTSISTSNKREREICAVLNAKEEDFTSVMSSLRRSQETCRRDLLTSSVCHIVRSPKYELHEFSAVYDEAVVRDGHQLVLDVDEFFRMVSDESGRVHSHHELVFYTLDLTATDSDTDLHPVSHPSLHMQHKENETDSSLFYSYPQLRGMIHISYINSENQSISEVLYMGSYVNGTERETEMEGEGDREWVVLSEVETTDDWERRDHQNGSTVSYRDTKTRRERERERETETEMKIKLSERGVKEMFKSEYYAVIGESDTDSREAEEEEEENEDEDEDEDGFQVVHSMDERSTTRAHRKIEEKVKEKEKDVMQLQISPSSVSTGIQESSIALEMDSLMLPVPQRQVSEVEIADAHQAEHEDVFEGREIRRAWMLVQVSQCLSRIPLRDLDLITNM